MSSFNAISRHKTKLKQFQVVASSPARAGLDVTFMAAAVHPAPLPAKTVDPSELVHNDKASTAYRVYTEENTKFHDRVSEFYHKNHKFQTVEFNKQIRERYLKLDKCTMNIWDAFKMLEEIIDESDPDTDSPQIVHAFQTAEALRKKYPEHDWLHLAGFLHDLGKITAHPKFGNDPQWCVVGDTFPAQCVYPEYFKENPDHDHPVYSTEYGIYEPNCGLAKLTMSWGHDEYMYTVLKGNNCTLPDEAMYVIRFHSFYPWHTNKGYLHLTNEKDKEMLTWVQAFQKCDLYSKSDNPEDRPDPVKLRPYYESLISKYFPSPVLRW